MCRNTWSCCQRQLTWADLSPPSVLRYQDILHSIHLTRKAKQGLRSCDGYSELLKYLRSDITEVASRLHKGGLGYLEDDVDLEEQVNVGRMLKENENRGRGMKRKHGFCLNINTNISSISVWLKYVKYNNL